ncbi:MAG: hypothetical protein ACK55I_48300, partial [bacterium]
MTVGFKVGKDRAADEAHAAQEGSRLGIFDPPAVPAPDQLRIGRNRIAPRHGAPPHEEFERSIPVEVRLGQRPDVGPGSPDERRRHPAPGQ